MQNKSSLDRTRMHQDLLALNWSRPVPAHVSTQAEKKHVGSSGVLKKNPGVGGGAGARGGAGAGLTFLATLALLVCAFFLVHAASSPRTRQHRLPESTAGAAPFEAASSRGNAQLPTPPHVHTPIPTLVANPTAIIGRPAHKAKGAGSASPLNNPPGFKDTFNHVAVVVVGGIGRTEHLAAAYASWTSVFRNRVFITDAPPKDHRGPAGMVDVLRNVYEGHSSDAEALKAYTHPEHPIRQYLDNPEQLAHREHFNKGMDDVTRELFNAEHSIGWHLGQPKYLLGLELVQQMYPNAKWYMVADSDTIVFPERLVAGLHLLGRNEAKPIAIGATTSSIKNKLLPKFTSFLGGAGVVVNQAAMQKMNISDCVRKQVDDFGWSTSPADWRIGLCTHKFRVQKEDQKYMYQSNEELNCLPHSPIKTCAWGGRYGQTMSTCPLTLHYQTPERMRALFAARSAKDRGGVCIPSKHWRDFTSACDCFSSAQAVAKAKEQPPSTMVLPGGTEPSEADIINAAIVETAKMVGDGHGPRDEHFHVHVKAAVEDRFQFQLFPRRKDISSVADATLQMIKNGGVAMHGKASSAAFRVAIAKSLLAEPTKWHAPPRIGEWAKKQV